MSGEDETPEQRQRNDYAMKVVGQGRLDRILRIFSQQYRIPVLGASGVGKTQCVQSIENEVPKLIDRLKRTARVEPHYLKSETSSFILLDFPGEDNRKTERVKGLQEGLKKGFPGIVHVVAYGYHEGMKGEDRAIAQNGQVNEAFLEERRSIELESMGEWVGLLGEAGKVGWVLTLVSKADIWWNRRDEVMAYYSSDTYLRSLGKLSNIHIGVLPYFSIFHKFYGRSPLSGLVDDEDRYRLRVELIDRLLEAIDPENALAYALPQDLHAVYQNLVIKKHFQGGLTPDEEQEMASLQKRLQQAHMATPLIRTTRRKAAADHEKRIRSLNASIQQLNNAVREAEARESSAMTEQQLLNIDPATT